MQNLLKKTRDFQIVFSNPHFLDSCSRIVHKIQIWYKCLENYVLVEFNFDVHCSCLRSTCDFHYIPTNILQVQEEKWHICWRWCWRNEIDQRGKKNRAWKSRSVTLMNIYLHLSGLGGDCQFTHLMHKRATGKKFFRFLSHSIEEYLFSGNVIGLVIFAWISHISCKVFQCVEVVRRKYIN